MRGLPEDVRLRVGKKIEALAEEARPPGTKKLQGEEGPVWRVRVGDYRVLYRIDDATRIVTVTRVRHRRDVYRGKPG
ncbi:MAG: type II toxin-antitoxin system RelE/ParE family toxin [Planctomycetales bacterium]|nr:type II toxin-antitoxin system RelE/ParE family toxin [Planctomycetales bacterium]